MRTRQVIAALAVLTVVAVVAFAGAFFGVRWMSRPQATTPSAGGGAAQGGAAGGAAAQPADDAALAPLVVGLDDSIILGPKSCSTASDMVLPLHFHTPVQPRELHVGRDEPSGMHFTVDFEAVGVKLPVDFKAIQNVAFNGAGAVAGEKGYYIQAGEHDFDGDGEPEIVIAVGNGTTNLVVNVIKYHPPANPADAGRKENWELLGAFEGQALAKVDGASLDLPYGSQGLYKELTLVKGKFVRTN